MILHEALRNSKKILLRVYSEASPTKGKFTGPEWSRGWLEV